MSYSRYHKAVEFLNSTLNLPIKDYLLDKKDRSFYIERLSWFLKLLGNPHLNFKFIHITGTAGKGSTVNLVHEILAAAGKKVGSYYSPHPTTSIERIKVGDKFISPKDFSELINFLKPKLLQAINKSPYGCPSYFEIFLTLAFLYFKKQKCQYVILEAGLGGTHDATNIIKKPIITAITNINHDHTKILGKTLSKIAKDKAGIIKPGSTFITAETRKNILEIFSKKCRQFKVPLITVEPNNAPNQNLAAAISAKLKIKDKYIKLGLNKAKLSCRFEIIQTKPLVILDGSHNPAKLKYAANKLKTIKYNKLVLIMGMAENKNIKKSLAQIVPLADKIILTRFLTPGRKSADLKKMAATRIKRKTEAFLDPWQALDHGLKITNKHDCLLITGSFFLAGELKTKWVSEEKILKTRQ